MATAAPLSTTTRLPRQVREQMQRIAEITAETQTDGGNTPPIETPPTPPGPAATPTPPAPPLAEQPSPEDVLAPQPELRPFRDPALETDPRAPDPMYWRSRLSVVQGKLAEERRHSDAREAALRGEIAELKEQIQALKAGAPAPVEAKSFLTPEQLDALGEDQAAAIVSAAVTAARTHVDATLAAQRANAETRRTQDTEAEAARRQRDFQDQMDDLVPNWRAIDARTDWKTWLSGVDPATGRIRQEPLTAAILAGDAQGAATIMRTFVQTLAPRPAPPVVAPNNANAPAAPTPPANVDRSMIAPTTEETRAFYKRASLGQVSDAERMEFEKRLALL